ncbi:hypothetical protein [Chitinophaga sp.]|uniref:hypothetical protein n=1 Tax=Chitinophaga sp. TaxID=1869181 RepID=UPI00260F2198|nr:hypothetical protein [uncultured Chitinophaga sp.]
MNDKRRKWIKAVLLQGAGFAILAISMDSLFHLEFRWKQAPAWIIAGILFGISMNFSSRKSQ